MLRLIAKRLPSALVTILLLPVVARRYFRRETGAAYGISLTRKLGLLGRMIRNNAQVPSASNFISHLLMAAEILNVPPDTPGVLVECGAYKGGSTVNLSMVAALCGRKLHVFDSFEGLPEPGADDAGHVVMAEGVVRTYESGAYAGTLNEVRSNVKRFGAPEACEFHKGYFSDTLPEFDEPVVFAYLDVDLATSEKECLRYLWPLLVSEAFVFTDEAHHLEIAELFFDREWWKDELHAPPPGLVGAGSGLGLFLHEGGFRSSIGYTVKIERDDLEQRPG
ncbi:MAG TPA: TylF/MycF/NovP-related O-methyltransferase [Acidimicrobiia bacterium]|nr:TylF/MycF/NovP-related O-methyltransferase [Acidimicrobiia bacterium]